MKDIIIDNRIVSDKTFATRFVSFLENIEINDPMSEEELEYIKYVARWLLLHQKATAINKNKIDYLCRCHPNFKTVL